MRHPLATYNAGGGLRTSAKVFATPAAIGSVAATGGAAALGEGAFFIGDDLVTAETLDSMSTAMGWTATDADFGVLAGDAISGACSKTMEDDLLSFGGDLAAFGAGRLLAGPLEGALRDVRTFGRPLPGAFTSRLAPLFFNATMPFATWEGANG